MNNVMNFFDSVLKYKNILIAYSGGVDSSVLLYKLFKIKSIYKEINIRAIHINHNFTNCSIFWEKFCIKQCKIYKIPIIIERLFFIKKKKSNIESCFRNLRYQFFLNYSNNNEVLFTAHHINDNCETFFLGLKRGSLLSGLSSIKFKFFYKNLCIIRPLLCYSKESLISYAKLKSINWINDHTNLNNIFDRNFIRNQILLLLNNKWKHFSFSILKISKFFFIFNEILNTLFINYLKICINKENIINLKIFLNFNFNLKIFILRCFIEKYLNIKCSLKQNLSLIQLIVSNKNKSYLKISNFYFFIYKNQLFPIFFMNVNNFIWNIKFSIQLFFDDYFLINIGNFKIALPKLYEKVYICYFNNIQNNHLCLYLIKLFNLLKISIFIRNMIPLVFYNEKLISIGDLFVTNYGKSKNNFYLTFKWYRK